MSASKISQIGPVGPIPNPGYEFGPFRLEPQNRLLLRENQTVALTPKAFDTLLFLVERSGRLVMKDELMSAVWPDTIVCESNLTQTIFMLRKALGESAGEHRYIVTVSGSGYRFNGEVRQGCGEDPAPELPTIVPPSPQGEGTNLKRHWRWAVVLIVLILSAIGIRSQWSPALSQPQPGVSSAMLAVLPFDNLTGDPAQDYFSDGFTEEMIAEVGRLDPHRLGVIARTSVMNYKVSRKPLVQIGRELGVQYVLEGSVRHDGQKVRIAAELIQLPSQARLWGRTYDRDVHNLIAVQDEIGESIAVEIRDALGVPKDSRHAEQSAVTPTNYEAYDLQLKARYSLSKRTQESLAQAAEYFRQAIAHDPKSARSYADLAATYALISAYSMAGQTDLMPRARENALHAIALNDHLADAHTALALIVQNYDWDWQSAEKEFRRSIELDPNNATAHQWYAEHLSWRGRFPEALAEIERARQLDPVSLIIAADRGSILYRSRQYDRAIEQFRAILDIEPTFPHAHIVAAAYMQQGRFDAALAEIEKMRRLQNGPWIPVSIANVYARSGKSREAERILSELRQIDDKQPFDAAAFASIYASLGKNDLAFAALEKARQQHSNSMVGLKVDPAWDPLRSDARFAQLLRSVNLEP